MDELRSYYEDKVVLVTGGAGSIGSAIVRELIPLKPKAIRVLDNNETGLFDLDQSLKTQLLRPFVGDVRDERRLERACDGADVVFHAAALKHVPLCEYNPVDAIKTNVIGTQNVINAAADAGVPKTVLVSTDKAVNPTNVMGATKLLAERLMTSTDMFRGESGIGFCCVRFGNVLDSRGSVVPLFRGQIKDGGPVTVTDPDMTRFFMSIPRAVGLILRAGALSRSGETFILKMPAMRIGDLAKACVEEFSASTGGKRPDVKVVGRRAGEKLHEELMTELESLYAIEDDELLVLLPQPVQVTSALSQEIPVNDALKGFRKAKVGSYCSKDAKLLSVKEIRTLLKAL